jgi:uncharacterized protein YcbK (DUF882 family)
MGDLSKDFSRNEYACKCGCGFDTVDTELNRVMQDLRDYYNRRIIITGGNRCAAYNAITPGAARDSRHRDGKANDFVVDGVSCIEVFNYLSEKYPTKYGIGLYSSPPRIHLDVRPDRARWRMG